MQEFRANDYSIVAKFLADFEENAHQDKAPYLIVPNRQEESAFASTHKRHRNYILSKEHFVQNGIAKTRKGNLYFLEIEEKKDGNKNEENKETNHKNYYKNNKKDDNKGS